jgi:hypothetical protein
MESTEYNPDTDPEVIALREQVKRAEVEAQAKADQFMKDDQLARTKGDSPEQVEARKRVAALYLEMHYPQESGAEIEKILSVIDYQMTVSTTNGRFVDMENPKGIGFLGFGRKPCYLVSKAYPPHDEQQPIYALEYFAVET